MAGDKKFYKDSREAIFTLKKLFQHMDLIRELGIESHLIDREDLIFYVPPESINAVKTAISRHAAKEAREASRVVINCATSPKRPDPDPAPEPLHPTEPDPPCRPGHPC